MSLLLLDFPTRRGRRNDSGYSPPEEVEIYRNELVHNIKASGPRVVSLILLYTTSVCTWIKSSRKRGRSHRPTEADTLKWIDIRHGKVDLDPMWTWWLSIFPKVTEHCRGRRKCFISMSKVRNSKVWIGSYNGGAFDTRKHREADIFE